MFFFLKIIYTYETVYLEIGVNHCWEFISSCDLAQVVPKVDNFIHWINYYPADNVVCFVNTYPLNSDLSVG